MNYLKPCYIFDIDGTLALRGDRGPFDWKKVGRDEPNIPITTILYYLNQSLNVAIVIFSGRDSICRSHTKRWLWKHGINWDTLMMRPKGDNRKDSIVKREMYEKIKNKYHVLAVFDDRNQVVEMWRSLGLTCLQVAEGNF